MLPSLLLKFAPKKDDRVHRHLIELNNTSPDSPLLLLPPELDKTKNSPPFPARIDAIIPRPGPFRFFVGGIVVVALSSSSDAFPPLPLPWPLPLVILVLILVVVPGLSSSSSVLPFFFPGNLHFGCGRQGWDCGGERADVSKVVELACRRSLEPEYPQGLKNASF